MPEPEPTLPLKEPSPQFMERVVEIIANPDPEHIAVGIVYALVSTLAASLVIWLAIKTWRGLSTLFWGFTAHLGAAPGLGRLVIRGYLRQVREKFGTVRNIYLDREEQLDLRRVFVPLTLRSRGNKNRDGNQAIDAPQTTREILTENPRLVILGAPGSGKTTLLKALASGISQYQWEEWKTLVPLFVSLRAFSRATDEPSLHHWLTHTLLPDEYNLRHAEPLLKKLLARGRLLLLLDGLDEVNAGDLSSVLTRITDFMKTHADGDKTRILLTCREQNYDLLSDAILLRAQGMTEYRLADMRESEVKAMVHSRRQDFEGHGSRKGNKTIPSFLEAIRANPRVYQLHRNPLLLTLSISLYLHRVDDAVPQHRAEFYHESIQHLLRRHDFLADPKLGKANRFEARDKYALLCRFALERMESAQERNEDFEDFQVAELIRSAEGLARNLIGVTPEEARPLIEEVRDHAGLIADTGNQTTYVFAHRSFHEYCAARELAGLGDAGFERLQEYLAQPAWRQTLLFYCGMDHRYAEKVVELLLDRKKDHGSDALTLAGYCAAVLVRPQVELRLNVVAALRKALSRATESTARRALLPSLLELGRDTPREVYDAVDETLRELNPAELAANLPRLGKAALPLLRFMVEGGDVTYQKAALQGIMGLEGLEKIDLLWQLLADFSVQKDTRSAAMVCFQLLQEMQAEGAVAQLNGLPAHFQELTEQELRAVYPFPASDNTLGNNNFARLLKLEADAIEQQLSPPPYLQSSTDSWHRFLALVLGPKDPKQARDWENLPAGRERQIWSIPWQWVGRFGVGLALLAGLWATVLVFLYGPRYFSNMDAATLIIAIAMFTGGSGLGAALLWPLWRGVAKRKGWLGDYGALSGMRPLLEDVAWRSPSNSRFKAVARSIGRTLGRAVLFSPLVLCWALALWLTLPNLEGHTEEVTGITFSPDGRRIITSSFESDQLWDLTTGRSREIHRTDLNPSSNLMRSVAFSPDGRKILTGFDETARLWDLATGREIRRFWHSGSVWRITNVAFSPDGRRILTSSDNYPGDNSTTQLWDAATGKKIHSFRHSSWGRSNIAFSPDGRRILTSSNNYPGDSTTQLWDAATGEEIYRFEHSYSVWNVALSPDGRKILTGFEDNTAQLWDLATDREICRFEHGDLVSSVAFSPDGRRILTGSDDRTARLWDTDTGEDLYRFEHSAEVMSVAFSPNGEMILTNTGDSEDKVWLWDTNTGQVIRSFDHSDWVYDVAFSPDGQTILTGSDDGSARLWDADTGELLWASPVPFWNPSTWNGYDILVFVLLVFLFGFFSTTKLFDPGRRLYLRKPNPYLHLYDIPGVEKWLPPEK